jgi:MFS family permease
LAGKDLIQIEKGNFKGKGSNDCNPYRKEVNNLNQEVSNSRKWITLGITSIATFMGTLNSTIVNVALPVMSRELKASINTIQWVVSSYLHATVILLLVWGKISDIYGKKYIFASGTLVFALESAFCGFSHSLVMLNWGYLDKIRI